MDEVLAKLRAEKETNPSRGEAAVTGENLKSLADDLNKYLAHAMYGRAGSRFDRCALNIGF